MESESRPDPGAPACRHYRVEANGLGFHVAEQGSGDPVVLLHGFPDTWAVWRHQLPALAQAAFRAIAPDLRGHGESDRPADPDAYAFGDLLRDLRRLFEALGIERAHVVGHDNGATLGWLLAALSPRRVDRLAVLSAGHPNCGRDPDIEQRERSWYSLLFQMPEVAEALLTRDDWRLFRQLMRNHAECERWIAGLSRPHALTAALGVYRANTALTPERVHEEPPRVPAVAGPVLGLWGENDFALTESQMRASEREVRGDWRYVAVAGGGHWLQLDRPERVNDLLITFLRGR